MNEEIITFGSARSLVGILHKPSPSRVQADLPTVVLLNAGILHRVGPNRLYVSLARQLERAGFHVFRFDVWGIGDSQDRNGDTGNRTFVDDTLEAFEMLKKRTGTERFMVMGVCMGAQIALAVADCDTRVESLVLMEGIYVKSARYYITRVLDPHKWHRVITGESHMVKKLRAKLLKTATKQTNGQQPAAASKPNKVGDDGALTSFLVRNRDQNMKDKLGRLLARGTRIMLVFRDGNEIAYNYRLRTDGDDIYAVGLPRGLDVAFIKFADHTFTPVLSQELLVKTTMKWVSLTHNLTESVHA